MFAGPPVSSITKRVCSLSHQGKSEFCPVSYPSHIGARPQTRRATHCLFVLLLKPSAGARVAPCKCLSAQDHTRDDRIELSEWIQLCPAQKKSEWMSRSSVHVMVDVNAIVVPIHSVFAMSWLPHPSLHYVTQCTGPQACW